MKRWRWADPDHVRATIAATWTPAASPDRLGDVTLREHQQDAAARLRSAIDRFGGALLADDVGLGKTYTALAAVRGFQSLLVVAPAAILDMWRGALSSTRVMADLISLESLSRSEPPLSRYAMVIIDEAHHARNRLTRRYARLAELTRTSRVLLLSATPLHNATSDLHTLLALFLGSRAEQLSAEQRAVCIVRRTHTDVSTARLPQRAAPTWLDVGGSPTVLEALMEIPAPCPPRNGGDGGALVTLSLVRAWASTDAALRATLRRRLARANALTDALSAGRYPTRAELRAWVVGDDATQLAFPELMVDAVASEWRTLGDAVGRHAAGLRRALDVLSADEGHSDDARCAIVRDIRRRHPGERIVVFSHFADSVRTMFDRLRNDGGVAAVTANGAWVASGPLTRADALARFTSTAASQSRAQAIEMLIATDLLSEGLNLQNASVVIHLDLPWTAARLTQRVGRVWRMSSPHARVHEFALAPPAPAEHVFRVIEVLRRKAGAASAAFGEAVAPLLSQRTTRAAPESNPITATESIRVRLRRWAETESNDGVPIASIGAPARDRPVMISAVRARAEGWVALVSDDTAPSLVARIGSSRASANPEVACTILADAEGVACAASPARIDRALGEIDAFIEAQRAATDAGVADVPSRAHAVAAGRIASVAARAPAHRRTAVSRLAVSARRAVERSRTAGSERLLRALLAVDPPSTGDDAGETWLAQLSELDRDLPNVPAPAAETKLTVLAAIVLVPDLSQPSNDANGTEEPGD